MNKLKILIGVLIILGVGTFLRFYKLDSLPPGLYPDEAVNGTDALQVVESNNFKIFYPHNNGREGLFINLLVLSFRFFGVSPFSLRFVSAIIGILTILGIYLLAKELFGYKTALFSSFLLASSFWHINFSRIGFRGILVPFVLVYLFYFLFRGLKFIAKTRLSIGSFVWAGLFFGLGFYTYIAYRIVPLILLILAVRWVRYFRGGNKIKAFWKGVVIFLIVSFIVISPLTWYFIKNPLDFVGRAGGVSIFVQPNPVRALGESVIKTLGMFNFKGDSNWRHNFSESPHLFLPVGILFVVGLILSFVYFFELKNKIYFRKSLDGIIRKDFRAFFKRESYLFLILCFFITLLPAMLGSEGNPHALRSIGVIPFLYIFSALPLSEGLRIKKAKLIILSLIFILLLCTAFYNFQKYFTNWAQRKEVKGAFREDLVFLGRYLNSLPSEIKRYIIVNEGGVLVEGIPMPAQTIKFITYQKSENIYLTSENIEKIKPEGKTLVIFLNYDSDLLKRLYSVFPFTQMRKIDNFYSFSNF